METKQKLINRVKSPAKEAHLREGKGFSLKEIKEAGKSVDLLKRLNVKIDFFRKSAYPENIEQLKSLKDVEKIGKKKQPFSKKEKKSTPFKPKIEKVTKDIIEKIEKTPDELPVEEKKKPAKKVKQKKAKTEKPEAEAEAEKKGTPLTECSGLGAATAKKLIELGVTNVEDLCKENPEDLAKLLKGVSAKRLKTWIEEGKDLLK